MDRQILKGQFALDRPPDWACPSCENGILRIKKESFVQEEPISSRNHLRELWDPDSVRYVYSCLLYCTSCSEVVACSGTGSVHFGSYLDDDDEPELGYFTRYTPTLFEPALKIINITESCPESVSGPLNESFKLFFAAPSAAANSIRVGLEWLLTELKIERVEMKRGEPRIISLHRRISLIPPPHQELKELLLAIKWLGNAGSHAQVEISVDDVLDAYEMMEHVLEQIYPDQRRARKMKAIAKVVNTKKGPA